MPVIDGYDDVATGGGGEWSPGRYDVTIDSVVPVTGEKDGRQWAALDVGITTTTGLTRSERMFYPLDTAAWQGMTNGQRTATKIKLDGLGLHISEVESETARGALIGSQRVVEVKRNGEYTNYNFQKPSQDGGMLPEPTAQHAPVGEPIVI